MTHFLKSRLDVGVDEGDRIIRVLVVCGQIMEHVKQLRASRGTILWATCALHKIWICGGEICVGRVSLTPPSDGLESRPCLTHPLGIGVWDASRLIDPETPPRHQGGGCTPLWTGTPTGAQLTLTRHYWVVI